MQKQPHNLLNLQNLMKRDPSSYIEEFTQQWQHYLHLYQMMSKKDNTQTQTHKEFAAILTFLSHVAPCFPHITAQLPTQLLSLLSSATLANTGNTSTAADVTQVHTTALSASLRLTITQCLILLQNRSMVSRFTLLPTFFTLFSIPDKPLRALLFNHIIHDIKRINKKKKQIKLNTALQNFMYDMLKTDEQSAQHSRQSSSSSTMQHGGDMSMAAKKSLDVMIELWRRRVWTDAKTVNVIVAACFSRHLKIMVAALRFFLGVSFYDEETELDSDEETTNMTDKNKKQNKTHASIKSLTMKSDSMKGMIKKRKKRERAIQRAVKKLHKQDHLLHSSSSVDVAAIHLIHDPQNFAERLFARLRSSTHSFPIRMLMMNVISRLIGTHSLMVWNFYPFLQKYLQPHQRHVTMILTYLAQATHPLIPPDHLRPCVMTLANHFVTDRSSTEVVMVGLNAIREICARQPLVMTRSLLLDLAAYKKHKVKGVMMASRSLIGLYRETHPHLLKKRERGKFVSVEERRRGEEGEEDDEEWAKLTYQTDVLGAELLAQRDQQEQEQQETDDAWNVQPSTVASDSDAEEEEKDEEDEKPMLKLNEVDEFLAELQGSDQDDDGDEKKDADVRETGKNGIASVDEGLAPAGLNTGQAEIDQEIDAAVAEGDDVEVEEEDDTLVENTEEVEDEAELDVSDEDDGQDDDAEEDEEHDEPDYGDDESATASHKRQRLSASNTSSNTNNPAPSATPAPSVSSTPSLPYAATKIFTPKDFEDLRQLRLQQLISGHSSRNKIHSLKRKSRGEEEAAASLVSSDGVGKEVSVESIRGYRPRVRRSKQDRLASVIEGRLSAEQSGGKALKGGGSTNAEKLKHKPFMLVKHSETIKQKQRLTFSQQQQSSQTHIKNLKKQGKKAKKRMKAKRGY